MRGLLLGALLALVGLSGCKPGQARTASEDAARALWLSAVPRASVRFIDATALRVTQDDAPAMYYRAPGGLGLPIGGGSTTSYSVVDRSGATTAISERGYEILKRFLVEQAAAGAVQLGPDPRGVDLLRPAGGVPVCVKTAGWTSDLVPCPARRLTQITALRRAEVNVDPYGALRGPGGTYPLDAHQVEQMWGVLRVRRALAAPDAAGWQPVQTEGGVRVCLADWPGQPGVFFVPAVGCPGAPESALRTTPP